MSDIKISAEGWRAIIANDFTVENLKRVTEATGTWMSKKQLKKVIIAFDPRFGGKMFSRKVAKVLVALNFEVVVCEKFVSVSMLLAGIERENADVGIYLTAGTYPYFFSGYQLFSKDGKNNVQEIVPYIPEKSTVSYLSIKEYKESGKLKVIDLESPYLQSILDRFNIDAIRKAELRIVVDAMHGAAQSIWPLILPESIRLRSDDNPSFGKLPPDPTPHNLALLKQILESTDYTNLGVGFCGAAEKFAIVDEKGNFVDIPNLKEKISSIKEVDDAVWITMSILEEMATTGKKLSEI